MPDYHCHQLHHHNCQRCLQLPFDQVQPDQKAVEHYTQSHSLDNNDLIKIHTCLKFLKFGMSSTLTTFKNKYYQYEGNKSLDKKGLTIGGYESAWLAMSFLLDTINQSLSSSH